MGAEKIETAAAARFPRHLFPQADRGVGIVTGARRQLDADDVRFRLRGTAAGQLDCQRGGQRGAGQCYPGLILGNRVSRYREIGGQRDRHFFGGVRGQRVRDFMAHDLRDFVIGGFELYNQSRVDGHLAAGHAKGIHGLRIVDDPDAPVPVAGLRAIFDRLRDQPGGDSFDARGQLRIVVDLALFIERRQHLGVGFPRGADRLVFGDDHEL